MTQDPPRENSAANTHADASVTPVSRRRAFQLGIAGAVAAGALALRGSLPGDAQAADGGPVLLGNPNDATQATVISTGNSGKGALVLQSGGNQYFTLGVDAADTAGGLGVDSAGGVGIRVSAHGPEYGAIEASAAGSDAAIIADNTLGGGVLGRSSDGAGVHGESTGDGPGVLAVNTGDGPALEVHGPTVFDGPVTFAGGLPVGSQAGTAIIPRGKRSVTVANPNITASSVILLTPLGNPMMFYGNGMIRVMLSYERRPGQGFTVYVEAAPPMGNLEVSYFIAQY